MLWKWLIYRRLPWVRGTEARDCGPAVFASLATYYRHHLSLEQARELVHADRDGTTLAGLRDGGRAIGLDSRPAQAIYDALAHIQLPAIVHTNGAEGHYMVLYRWTPAAVIVLDPSAGLRRIARAAFEADWSGYLVEYHPTPALKPHAPDVRPLRLFAQFARAHAHPLLAALVFALVAIALGWTFSFFLRLLIDRLLPNHEVGLLAALGAGLLCVSVLQALLQFGRLRLSAHVGRAIYSSYSARFIEHLLALPMAVFDARCVAGLVMRINQADQIQQAVSELLVTLVADGAMFLAALGVLAAFDPIAALIALGAVPLMLGVIVLLNERAQQTQLLMLARMETFAGQMMDLFQGLRTIKTFSAEERYRDFLNDKLDSLVAARYANRTALILPNTWSTLATALISALILWYGSARVLAGQLTPGDLIVLFGMVAFYLGPVQRLPNTVLTIRNALIGIGRMEEILMLPAEQARTPDPQSLPAPVQGRIELAGVSFGYKPRQRVLHEVSLTIAAGETVAIVGETGAGKSSLANLIAGFYLPTEGEVRIDGISTRDLAPAALREAISAVFQDTHLFQHSVRENITMLGDAPLDAVEQAARQANAATFIHDLLRGYATQVARGGDNFSAGQAQRIALARALLKDAPILLLDEATSNLDGATEQGIVQALEASRRGRTTVLIAHRLSTIVRADRIVVLDGGRVVEEGTHTELLAQRGRYHALFHAQMIGEERPRAVAEALIE